MEKRTEEIKAKVLERFKQDYPNTHNSFNEYMPCFVSFIVEETIKELEDKNE